MKNFNSKVIPRFETLSEFNSITSNGKNSPFSLYEGEKLNAISPKNPHSINLTELQQFIIESVNKLLFVQSKLLHRYFEKQGLQIGQSTLQSELKRLADLEYLNRFEFISPTSICTAKVYSVGYRGRGFLHFEGTQTRLTGYASTLTSFGVKRILSATQLSIELMSEGNSLSTAQIVFVPEEKKDVKHIFRSHSLITSADESVFVLSVRTNENWRDDIVETLKRVDATLRNQNHNIQINRNKAVVLVAESPEHLIELVKTVRDFQGKDLNVFFTYDTLAVQQGGVKFFASPKRNLFERLFVA